MKSAAGFTFAAFLSIFFIVAAFSFIACSGSSSDGDSGVSTAIYPMFLDENSNNINDYFEEATHDAGSAARAPGVQATYGHGYVDADHDGICDYSQNGSNTWHGPGFIDEDGDGVCDYWEEASNHYNLGGGMRWRDQNRNGVNDYFERQWHEGYMHDYVDADGDGVCDHAQDGTAGIWHGPGYIDENSDGVCDHWQEGGRGHGASHGHGHGQGGM